MCVEQCRHDSLVLTVMLQQTEAPTHWVGLDASTHSEVKHVSLSLSLCRLSLNACAEDVSHQALCSERACGCAHQLTNRTSTKIKQTQINKNNSKAELRQRTLSVEWIIGPPNHAHIPFSWESDSVTFNCKMRMQSKHMQGKHHRQDRRPYNDNRIETHGNLNRIKHYEVESSDWKHI